MKTPVRTIIGGVDTPDIDTWPQVLWDYFSPDWSDKMATSTAYYRVLFAPSFHPECCVTVIDLDGAAEVSLLTYRANLWYWGCYERQRANGKWLPSDPPPPAPQRWKEAALLEGERVQRFQVALPAAIPLLPAKMNSVGCDGMTVYCRFKKQGGEPRESRTWGASEPGTHGLAVAVHRLASEVLKDAESRKALEAVKSYGDEARPSSTRKHTQPI
jgi:hypothetical protein